MPSLRARSTPAFLITFGCTYALIAIVSGEFHFWNGEGLRLAGGARSGLLTAGIMTAFGLLLCRQLRTPLEASLSACATALAFLLVTDWTTHSYSFFSGSDHPRGGSARGAFRFLVGAQKILVHALPSPPSLGSDHRLELPHDVWRTVALF